MGPSLLWPALRKVLGEAKARPASPPPQPNSPGPRAQRHPASRREDGRPPSLQGEPAPATLGSTRHAAPPRGSPPPDPSVCRGGPRGLLHCGQRPRKREPHPTPGYAGIQGLPRLQPEPPWAALGAGQPPGRTLRRTLGRGHHHLPPGLARPAQGVGRGGCQGGEAPRGEQWLRPRWAERRGARPPLSGHLPGTC